MPKTYEITHEDAVSARNLMKSKKIDVKSYRRLEVIALRGEGKKNIEIANTTKFCKDHVSKIVSKFIHSGFENLLRDKRSGKNRKVTEWQEVKVLKGWRKKAERGEIISTKERGLSFQENYEVTITIEAFNRL